MNADPWLERWLPLVAEHSRQKPILELGCGQGDDTITLANAGHRVDGEPKRFFDRDRC